MDDSRERRTQPSPAASDSSISDPEASSAHEIVDGTCRSVRALTTAIFGDGPRYNMIELAERAGTSVTFARKFWRAMGFPNVTDEEANFNDDDVAALNSWVRVLASDMVDETTVLSLLRAQSYTMDRLALWQAEAMVEDLQRRRGLDDTNARRYLLEHLDSYESFVADQITYAWRRHMVGLAERTDAEVHARRDDESPDGLPLPRALGFVDMVSFTSTSRQLGSRGLAELVQGFEFTARDVITSNGARVVKMVGDAVLYIADDVLTGARVALALIEAVRGNPVLLPVRASLIWGRVVSRSGDVFGPAVNLASRLIGIAPPEALYTDESTAALLAKNRHAADFLEIAHDPVALQGIGEVVPIELRWATPSAREDTWIPT